jgi:heme A synthase
MFGLADFPAWVGKHPVGGALLAMLLVSYIVAFICLSKIRTRRGAETMRLWLVSLIAACVPLGVLAYLLGPSSAVLIIGMAEVAAIALHLTAIAIIAWQNSPPNNALERP